MKIARAIRDYLKRKLRAARLKAERVQARFFPPFEVPMTRERIQDRAARLSKGWQLVAAPVALRFHRTFATFRQCTEFANGAVADLVEKHGLEPTVQIDGTEVTLILGIEAPPILSEGDFDFAQAIDPPSTQPDKPGLVHKPRKAA